MPRRPRDVSPSRFRRLRKALHGSIVSSCSSPTKLAITEPERTAHVPGPQGAYLLALHVALYAAIMSAHCEPDAVSPGAAHAAAVHAAGGRPHVLAADVYPPAHGGPLVEQAERDAAGRSPAALPRKPGAGEAAAQRAATGQPGRQLSAESTRR